MSEARVPRLVIVGRPNVGKSTLFNRLLGQRRALVHDMPGVTRDRLIERTTWWVKDPSVPEGEKHNTREYPVDLVDTGGLGHETFHDEIALQVRTALEEADIVLVTFDGQAGLTPADEDVVRQLMASGVTDQIPAIAVVNKVDAHQHEPLGAEFFSAGLDPVLTISAEHGRGIDDLKDIVSGLLDERGLRELPGQSLSETEEQKKLPKLAIVGRPNVGKSTLVNALLGEARMITSPIAGTTVDSVDSYVEMSGNPFMLIDTAGVRRKNKTEQGVEVLSVVQTKKALDRADIAILVMDGETGVTDQDEKIAGLIQESGCSVILAVNKWDTQRKNVTFTQEAAAEQVRKQMPFLHYAPLMFISAKRKQGLEHIGDLAQDIMTQRQVRVPTHEFSEWVRARSEIHNPANVRFYMCHQVSVKPPTFICRVNDPEKVHYTLSRHLVNAIRERWGYMGSPVRLLFKGR